MPPSLTERTPAVQDAPNVTPMIDVLLVLLIIYLVASRVRMGIDVQVPEPAPAAGQPGAAPPQIVLELTGDGGYRINGQPVPDAWLDTQLGQIFARRPARPLFIRADPERTYQDVIRAMDRARGVGVRVIALVPRGGPGR